MSQGALFHISRCLLAAVLLTSGATAGPVDKPSREQCVDAGGLWNDCGRLTRCYFFPEDPCPEVCVTQCECGGFAGFPCPEGYACLNSTIIADGIGVCIPEELLKDEDDDGIPALLDNCPTVANPDQADDNFDGIGNACTPFRRGDLDGDGLYELTDALQMVTVLLLPGATSTCFDALDADDNERLALADAIVILRFIFIPGTSIPPPGPTDCAADPQRTATTLDCAEYKGC